MALSNVMETKDGVYEVMKVFLKIDHEVVILEEDVSKFSETPSSIFMILANAMTFSLIVNLRDPYKLNPSSYHQY